MTVFRDIGETWRSLARSPYFTIPVVLSLGLAIGANTAAFSVLDALVLRPLPIAEPDRLFQITYAGDGEAATGGNYTWFERVRDRARSVSAAFIYHRQSVTVVVDGQPDAVSAALVSGGAFAALGQAPRAGRLIAAADETSGGVNRVAVIGDAFWASRFGRDPAAIGTIIRVEGVPHEVIGVTRPEFFGLEVGRRVDVIVPIDGYREDWVSMNLLVRLQPGLTPSAADGELTALLHELAAAQPLRRDMRTRRVVLQPAANGLGGIRDRYVTPALAIAVILAVTLLLACANWAMLLMAKTAARRRDSAIRRALGSSRFRLARRSVIESVSLALAGGLLGFIGATWSVALLPGNGLPDDLRIEPHLGVLAFSIGTALVAGVLFAAGPAWLTAHIQADDFRVSSRSDDARTSRLGRVLVAAQVALSLTLVIGAVLFAVTLRNLRGQTMGFDGAGVVTFTLDADGTGVEGDRLIARHRLLLERLRGIPGVRSATLASVSPLSGNEDGKGIVIPGFVARTPDDLVVNVDTIGPGYFDTFGVPVLRGRAIAEADAETSPHVALISESAARFYFGDADPIGRRMEIRGSTILRPEIVGIAADVMYDDLRSGAERMFYVPFAQRHAEGKYVFAVRGDGDATLLARHVPPVVRAVSPDMPVLELTTMARQIEARSANERLLAASSAVFGVLALILAGIGVYGIMAHTIARRIPEIGVRVALGATPARVAWLIVESSMAVIAAGLVTGLVASLWAAELIDGLVFGVTTTEPWVYAMSVAFLLVVGVVAIIPPVLRGLRVQPSAALRCE
jgi:predicted permease